MRADLVLVLDAGTGGGRAAIYDEYGERVASAERRWHAIVPPALAPFGRKYDPDVLRAAIDEVVLEALAYVDPERVAAIACTGQRVACAFVDEAGEALYVGPNGDVRALAGAELDGLDDEVLYERTGRFPPWIFAPARLRWFEANAPVTFSSIRHVLGLPGWLAFEYTGVAGVDATLAADLMMLDVASRERAPVDSRLPDDAWPALRAPQDTLGVLRPDVAARLGLPTNTPVAVGCADTQAALPFAGADTLVAGSSAPLLRSVDEPLRDPKRRLWLDPHLTPGRFCLEANLGEMGTGHRWLLNTLALESFELFDELARQAPLGCRGASSHLGPRAMDLRDLNTGRPAALMMPFGETTLAAAPGRAELARSYLESCAYAALAGRTWLNAVSPAAEVMHLVGGLSRSAFFGDVLASVLETPVLRGPSDATARGAAACAMVAGELASSFDDAVSRMRRAPVRHEPRDDYEDAYERWLEREESLEEM